MVVSSAKQKGITKMNKYFFSNGRTQVVVFAETDTEAFKIFIGMLGYIPVAAVSCNQQETTERNVTPKKSFQTSRLGFGNI